MWDFLSIFFSINIKILSHLWNKFHIQRQIIEYQLYILQWCILFLFSLSISLSPYSNTFWFVFIFSVQVQLHTTNSLVFSNLPSILGFVGMKLFTKIQPLLVKIRCASGYGKHRFFILFYHRYVSEKFPIGHKTQSFN